MRANAMREIWAKDGWVLNTWLSTDSPFAAQVMAHQGFDTVTVDLQHGIADYSQAGAMLNAIHTTDATAIVRVPWLEPGIIMKVLDAGAQGVICPMINTPEDARALVAACRYAPLGRRSFGPTRALFVHGPDYPAQANGDIVAFAMIETRQALDNLDAIVATPGLDALYIGPADLALSLGHQPGLDPTATEVMTAIEQILSAAHGAGLKAAIHTGEPAYARSMLAKGFDMVTIGSDVRFLAQAGKATVGTMRGEPIQRPAEPSY
ncbi:HpcH/HpaI aldolase family protein [Marinivivus vitaminiproducens]|uniref:HpcH/HpaI aldolase family protein n=1 Tax=Marinivivus vitaminiproducens TaxID=3035935 RepID=UPI002799E6C0|nr:aldolase/citrate lyase family protein [Geminicoccaceae bacterium SCSIO 64248]